MALNPASIIPSGRYIAIYDNMGLPKVLEQPSNSSILIWDGTDAYWADGSSDHPIPIGGLTVVPSDTPPTMNGLVMVTPAGMLYGSIAAFVGSPPFNKKYLTCTGPNTLVWQTMDAYPGIPAIGSGVLTRAPVATGDPEIAPVFLSDKGLTYVDLTGLAQSVSDGTVGQILTMVNSLPTWANPPAGSVSAGVASTGLTGVNCTNISVSAVSVTCPALTVAKADGTTAKLTNVNVNANLTASLGVGGLDVGAETTNQWYYIYVVSDGSGGIGACLSTSGASPDLTNLAAYIYFSNVGVFRNDNSGNIVNFVQRGRDIWTRPVVYTDNVASTTAFNPVPAGVGLTTILPPNVKSVRGMTGGSSLETTFRSQFMAADGNGMAEQAISGNDFTSAVDGFIHGVGNFNLPIIDSMAPTMYWKTNSNSSHRRLVVTGYSI